MMDEQILQEFIQEGLTLVDEAMDRIGPQGCEPGGVNAVFRCLHTIKGASGFLNLKALSLFVHRFEDVLKQWQEENKGLNPEEGRQVLEGLRLTQAALVKVRQIDLPEGPAYRQCLRALTALREGEASLAELETLLGQLKAAQKPDLETNFRKEMVLIRDHLKNLLAHAVAVKRKSILPLDYKTVKQVMMADQDLTAPCTSILKALETISSRGKAAFADLNSEALEQDLKTVTACFEKNPNFLSFDIINDFCEDSPEVVEEAFRRFWSQGVGAKAKVDFQEVEVNTGADTTEADKARAASESAPRAGEGEEYLRISLAVIQRMTDGIRRYLRNNYVDLDKHVNSIEQELSRLTNRQLDDAFKRIPAMVEKLSRDLGKNVRLSISGGEIEIPRDLLRALNDPLVHIVRNSLDHGLETAKTRETAGKPGQGTLKINAVRNEDSLMIRIEDDGKGLDGEAIRQKALDRGLIKPADEIDDKAVYSLIFLPGFSTAAKTTEISGRGVGLDVVRTTVEAKGGSIQLDSTLGQGTVIELHLPLTEAYRTQDVLLINCGNLTCGVEYQCLKEVMDEDKLSLHAYKDQMFFPYRETLIPYINIKSLFGLDDKSEAPTNGGGRVIVVQDEQKNLLACRVDQVNRKVKVVVAPFVHDYLKNNPLIRGTAILGTGEPYLIIDFRDISKIIR